MPRNVEVKARVVSIDALRPDVVAIADRGPFEIAQDDTFFHCPSGRLKLRVSSETQAELIYYRRSDQQGPKESFYVRAPASDPNALRETLTLAYGQSGRVRKHRTLLMHGRTRIHLDRVESLGDFLELEVMLAENEPLSAGVEEAQSLLSHLKIAPTELLERAYVDLLSA